MERSESEWKFGGFASPNFTSVPDEFFDELVPRLGNAEIRVLLYIIRRTFGFKKQTDAISLSQMVDGIVRKDGTRLDAGTGLKKAAVCRALTSLENSGIIIRTKQFASSGGAIATSYQLRMNEARIVNAGAGQTPVYGERQGTQTPCLRRETGAVHQKKQTLSTGRDTQYTVNNIQLDNNVNVSKKPNKRNPLHELEDIEQPNELMELIASDILEVLGDQHSKAFYRLVAQKIPESIIRKTLSELKQGRAKSTPRVFTNMMMSYAEKALERSQDTDFISERHALSDQFKKRCSVS
jgi:hypothetical protein